MSKNTNQTVIPIYNLNGDIVNELVIKEKITHVGSRVSRGKDAYYKGTGVPYMQHYTKSLDGLNLKNDYEVLGHTDVFYLGYAVKRKVWDNKFGIFQARYHPFFPDFIGACSIKEKAITPNSQAFKKSSVDILDVILYDKENQQFYFKLNYKCDRKNYVTHDGDPKKLRVLIDYMLDSEWNFLWDKGSINDITPDGLVSDVADLFISDELEHQFGSVYSVLYSLHSMSRRKYHEFLACNDLEHIDKKSFVTNAIKILEDNNIDTSPLFPHDNDKANYIHTVMYYLLKGKNCAYCSCDMFMAEGDLVRQDYWNKFMQEVQAGG